MSDAPPQGVVELVDGLIRRAIDARASDVHFEPGDDVLSVRFRVDGLLGDAEQLPAVLTPNIVARLKVLGGLLTYRCDIPQEGGMDRAKSGYPCDIRVASFPTIRGERVVLRLMAHAHQLLRLDELGFDPRLTDRLEKHLLIPQGLLIVCGPAGSGKTTTLYALLDYIQGHRAGASIIAVEDPVEIRLPGITQIEVEPQRNLTYAVVLRSLLRQDPQVLMIGEIRDAETAHIVIEAALTGHLLLSTIHSGTPAEAIVRLREMGIPAYQLTSTLCGVLAQRLLRTTAGSGPASSGRAPYRPLGTVPAPSPGIRAGAIDAGLGETRSPSASEPVTAAPDSYIGRTACGHFVELTHELRRAILEEADAGALSDPALCPGSLRDDAERLVRAGRTTVDEVRRVLGP